MEPSDPCLSLWNLRIPASVYETFRHLFHPWKLHNRLLSQPTLLSDPCLHCKKRLAIFSSRPGIIKLFPARESLVSDIQAGDRKIDSLFSVYWTFQTKNTAHPLLFLVLLFTQVMSLVILPVPSLVMRKSRSLIFCILLQMDHHKRFVHRVPK